MPFSAHFHAADSNHALLQVWSAGIITSVWIVPQGLGKAYRDSVIQQIKQYIYTYNKTMYNIGMGLKLMNSLMFSIVGSKFKQHLMVN